MRHPTTNEMVERKIEVHKDKTLREATLEAHKVSCPGLKNEMWHSSVLRTWD